MKIEDYLKGNIEELKAPKANREENNIFKTFFNALFALKFFLPSKRGIKENGLFAQVIGFAFLLVAGIQTMKIIPDYFPKSIYWQFARFVSGITLAFCFVVLLLVVGIKFSSDERRRKKIIKHYQQNDLIQFTNEQYKEAAGVLCNFKKITYEEAIEKYGKEIVDLLILANGIFFDTEKRFFTKQQFLKRLVSISAIEKDKSI